MNRGKYLQNFDLSNGFRPDLIFATTIRLFVIVFLF